MPPIEEKENFGMRKNVLNINWVQKVSAKHRDQSRTAQMRKNRDEKKEENETQHLPVGLDGRRAGNLTVGASCLAITKSSSGDRFVYASGIYENH